MNNTRYLVAGYVENTRDKLEGIVDTLYENPETSFNEKISSALLMDILRDEGFEIQENIAKIKNSFSASYGFRHPRIAYICEYDAIEGVGHGCGHNITSGINIGAAIGLKRAIDEIGGGVVVIGCPAEENHYTKITMMNNGIFDDMDAIICGHARDKTSESGTSLGMTVIHIAFKGYEAHSSINFKDGKNALYPCVMLFNLVETLKSRYTINTFINGIITHGGRAINIIPGESRCMFMVKSTNKEIIDNVCEEIINCAKFSAKIYSCDMEYTYPEPEYMPLKTHSDISRILCHNLKERGIDDIHGPLTVAASLDIGNISHRVPTVHPYIGICENPVQYYTKDFSDCTIKHYAKTRMLEAATALALTGVDIIQNPDILKKNP
jgi:amidohydrolase